MMSCSAVIPAHDEEKTIQVVVKNAVSSGLFDEVIVVDDGSADATGVLAAQEGARVITHASQQGKGAAMRTGACSSRAQFLFFMDADIKGFTKEHMESLLRPIIEKRAIMTVGIRDRGRVLTRLLPKIAPVLGGERVFSRESFLQLPGLARNDFGIETILNAFCKAHRVPVVIIPLWGVTQVIKEQKYGILRGFFARARMVAQVIRATREAPRLFKKISSTLK